MRTGDRVALLLAGAFVLLMSGFFGYTIGTGYPNARAKAEVLCPTIGGTAVMVDGNHHWCLVGSRLVEVP